MLCQIELSTQTIAGFKKHDVMANPGRHLGGGKTADTTTCDSYFFSRPSRFNGELILSARAWVNQTACKLAGKNMI